MSAARATYHHGDLPRALVAASLALIRTDGVDGFSLRAAARQAGVNPAAVYRHFADRAALLRAVAVEGFDRLADEMAASADEAGTDAANRFRAFGTAYVRFAVENPEFFRVMFGPYGAGGAEAPARGRSGGAAGRSPYALLASALDDLGRTGQAELRGDEAVVAAWSAVHGLAQLLVDGAVDPLDGSLDRTIAVVTAAALRGLGTR